MAKSKELVKVKKVPAGVQIISVLYYIGAVLGVVCGILFIIGAGYIQSVLPDLGAWGPGLLIFGGVVCIGFAVLGFFIGRGLWRAQAWARILAIIFAIIGVISAIVSLIRGGGIAGNITTIVINAIIGIYLAVSKEVKEAFR